LLESIEVFLVVRFHAGMYTIGWMDIDKTIVQFDKKKF